LKVKKNGRWQKEQKEGGNRVSRVFGVRGLQLHRASQAGRGEAQTLEILPKAEKAHNS
jgi:hypothetical protein